MKKLLFAAAATVALVATTPALAGGVGVRVGPVGAGVGPSYDRGYDRDREGWRHRDRYGYAGSCRTVRERVETPSGRVIFRTHRTCD